MNKISKICSKSSIKPALCHVYVTKDHMEATDGYRYVRLANKGFNNGYYHQKTGAYSKKIDGEFPDVTPLFNRLAEKEKDTINIRFNRKFLIEVLTALGQDGKQDMVDMKVSTKDQAEMVKFENGNGLGLIMPIKQ